jgi:steroid 5-alpha reductase family enzyme
VKVYNESIDEGALMNVKQFFINLTLLLLALAFATQGFSNLTLTGLLVPLIMTLLFFTAMFLYAQAITNNSIVDIGWGMGFVVGALSTLWITPQPTVLSYAISAFITVWGLRLSTRLFRRNWTKPEDFRYAQWRKDWGNQVISKAFFRVFLLQGLINYLVGVASYVIIYYNRFDAQAWGWVSLGFGLALVGFFFEVVGDEQLRRHIQKGTKRLLQTGLWSLTRHPNYFGEILIWVGLYGVALTLINRTELSLWYLIALGLSPVVMSSVLIFISTPLLEAHMKKYEGWSEYTQRVPMMFPFTAPSRKD